MWSYTQERMISSLEEAIEGPEKIKQRRRCTGWKFLYYSCCFLYDPYKSHNERDEILINNNENG